ncbi:MAG: TolC family protein [Gammaproteobacteria bacterium]|nr:TolC family protein [Gammaproteobacteria bacterium]
MTRTSWCARWLAVALTASSAASMAAAPAPSLAEMVTTAASHNSGMALAEAERGVASALQSKAEQPFAGAPTANLKYQTDAVGSGTGYREWEGGIEVPLWLPGQSDAYAREAERTRSVSDTMQAAYRLQVSGDVRDRLWSAAIARSEAQQAHAALAAARTLLDDVQRRVGAGELPRSDRLLAEKAVLEREEAAQLADTRAGQLGERFRLYTGMPLPDQLPQETAAADVNLTPDHPQLRLSRDRVEQARARRDRVSKTRRSSPSVWLGGKSSQAVAGSGYDSAVGIELSVPFGGSAHTAPELATAEAELTRAQVDHANAQRAVEDELAQAKLELERAKAAVGQTQRRRDLAEQSLTLSQRAFALGETDLIRLLQVQADALAARHDLDIRELERDRAVSRLNQALGVTPQ